MKKQTFFKVDIVKIFKRRMVLGAIILSTQLVGLSTMNAANTETGSYKAPAPPTIALSTTTLTGISYTLNYGPSNFQFFNVSGSSLTAGIVITPSTNLEISTAASTGYQSTAITLPKTSTTVSATNIFVRLKAGLPVANYNSEIITLTTNGGTSKSVTCSGSVLNLPTISIGGGSIVCAGSSFDLTSSGTDICNLYWQGPDKLYSQQPNLSFTNSTVAMSGTYTITGGIFSGSNLIKNGDFEAGNVDFGSSYTVNTDLQPEGRYAVIDIPKSVHPSFGTCTNHTPYGTLQMVVNGAVAAGVNVWSQTATVKPGTDYQFTYWVQSVVGNNPSQMQLYVNGIAAGPTYTALPATCQWIKFIYNWNSGTSTVANLSLVNQNTVAGGNDFALDDIVFQETVSVTASANVVVNPVLPVSVNIVASTDPIYSGPAVTFTATPVNGGTTPVYQWKVNGTTVGTNSNTYTYVPVNNDQISCTLTSNATPCATGNPAISVLTLAVKPNIWKGTVSTDWNTPANWIENTVPPVNANISFDANPLNNCLLDQNRIVNNISNAQNAYKLVANGKTLTVKNSINFTNSGQIDASAVNSTVEFAGTAAQTISSGLFTNNQVYNITVNNPGNVVLNGTLNILNSLTANSGRLDASTTSPTVVYGGASTQSISSSPYLGDKVYNLIIDNADVSLLSDFTVDHQLSINSGKKLTIPTGNILNVNGTIQNDAGASGLVIKASSTGTAANGSLIFHNSALSTVPATVEMYSKASKLNGDNKWQFIGIPVSSTQADIITAGSLLNEMHENVSGTNGQWVNMDNASTLTSFTGYKISQDAAKTVSFQGNLENKDYNSGQLSFTSGATFAGLHLIGNPYTATININKIIFGSANGSIIDNSVYLYNTGSTSDWTSAGLSNSSTNYPGQYVAIPQTLAGIAGLPAQIPSMQAFLVSARSNNAAATVTIPYSSVGTVVKNSELQRVPAEKIWTRIDVKGANFADCMWIFTESSASHGFDNGWDGFKILGSTFAPQIYAAETAGNFQVNTVNDINNTFLGFQPGSETNLTLTFTHQGSSSPLYLMDLNDTKTIDISATGSQYSFTATAGASAQNRFKIVTSPGVATELNSVNTTSPFVFNSGNTIVVRNPGKSKGSIYIFDITGKFVQINEFSANGITTISTSLNAGTYIVKAITDTITTTTRLVIH